MGLAAGGQDAVGGHGQAARLEPFLQLGLGVLAPAVGFGAVDQLTEQLTHQPGGSRQAAIKEQRADHRFDRITKDRWPLRTATPGLALGQAQHLGQAQRDGGAVQAVLTHEVGANAGQITFIRG